MGKILPTMHFSSIYMSDHWPWLLLITMHHLNFISGGVIKDRFNKEHCSSLHLGINHVAIDMWSRRKPGSRQETRVKMKGIPPMGWT